MSKHNTPASSADSEPDLWAVDRLESPAAGVEVIILRRRERVCVTLLFRNGKCRLKREVVVSQRFWRLAGREHRKRCLAATGMILFEKQSVLSRTVSLRIDTVSRLENFAVSQVNPSDWS